MRASAPLLSAPLIVMVTMVFASGHKYATFMPPTSGPTTGNSAHSLSCRASPADAGLSAVRRERRKILSQCHAPDLALCNRQYKGLQAVTSAPVNRPLGRTVFRLVPPRKERTMKTNKFRLLSVAGLAVSALMATAPALAHDGYRHGHVRYGAPYFVHPGHRVVVVRPVVVYPAPVYYAPYYAPAPVYYSAPAPVVPAPTAAATVGGAIAGAAIGGIVSHGRPGAIVAGSVIGAVVGNGLAR